MGGRKRKRPDTHPKPSRNRGLSLRRNKKKTLRHLIQKFFYEIEAHAAHCRRSRLYRLSMIDRFGPDWNRDKRYWCGASDWHSARIHRLVGEIREAGGIPNYRHLKEKY